MENYFNYFTEIEERFQQRRGALSLLSPLDWALMEIWKDAGIPLEAVIRGIDASFDKWEQRPKRTRKINGLAYCAQEVLAAAEEMKEAAVGGKLQAKESAAFEAAVVIAFLRGNADELERASLPESAQNVAAECTAGLREVATGFELAAPQMEDVERRMTVMEEKLIAAILAGTPESALLQVRTEADRDLAPYRGRMTAPQIEQLHKQYVQKRLLEQHRLPRLSLFYMQ